MHTYRSKPLSSSFCLSHTNSLYLLRTQELFLLKAKLFVWKSGGHTFSVIIPLHTITVPTLNSLIVLSGNGSHHTYMYADFIIHIGMPEVLLLNARVPHPHTDKLLHRTTKWKRATALGTGYGEQIRMSARQNGKLTNKKEVQNHSLSLGPPHWSFHVVSRAVLTLNLWHSIMLEFFQVLQKLNIWSNLLH